MPVRPASVVLRSALAISASLLGCSGCARPIAPDTPTAAAVSQSELDTLWQATLDVLMRMELPPDRQDRANGVIETLPVTSKQFWEFWRRDVADPYSQAVSDLQTIQRKVIVRFSRLPTPERWRVEVEVPVYRMQMPERQLTSSSTAIELYGSTVPTTTGEIVPRQRVAYLEPLGRDAALEDRILDLILSQSGATEYELVDSTPAPPSRSRDSTPIAASLP